MHPLVVQLEARVRGSRDARTQPAPSGQPPHPRLHRHAGKKRSGGRPSRAGEVSSREWAARDGTPDRMMEQVGGWVTACRVAPTFGNPGAEPKSRITFAVTRAAVVCWAQQAQGTIWAHWKRTWPRRSRISRLDAFPFSLCCEQSSSGWEAAHQLGKPLWERLRGESSTRTPIGARVIQGEGRDIETAPCFPS